MKAELTHEFNETNICVCLLSKIISSRLQASLLRQRFRMAGTVQHVQYNVTRNIINLLHELQESMSYFHAEYDESERTQSNDRCSQHRLSA